jgi:hypothetical protein
MRTVFLIILIFNIILFAPSYSLIYLTNCIFPLPVKDYLHLLLILDICLAIMVYLTMVFIVLMFNNLIYFYLILNVVNYLIFMALIYFLRIY